MTTCVHWLRFCRGAAQPASDVYAAGATLLFLLSGMCRVGQNHIYTVCIRYYWQGNHQIYGHIRCIYTVLANPRYVAWGFYSHVRGLKSMRVTWWCVCTCAHVHTQIHKHAQTEIRTRTRTHAHAHVHTHTHTYTHHIFTCRPLSCRISSGAHAYSVAWLPRYAPAKHLTCILSLFNYPIILRARPCQTPPMHPVFGQLPYQS